MLTIVVLVLVLIVFSNDEHTLAFTSVKNTATPVDTKLFQHKLIESPKYNTSIATIQSKTYNNSAFGIGFHYSSDWVIKENKLFRPSARDYFVIELDKRLQENESIDKESSLSPSKVMPRIIISGSKSIGLIPQEIASLNIQNLQTWFGSDFKLIESKASSIGKIPAYSVTYLLPVIGERTIIRTSDYKGRTIGIDFSCDPQDYNQYWPFAHQVIDSFKIY